LARKLNLESRWRERTLQRGAIRIFYAVIILAVRWFRAEITEVKGFRALQVCLC
jgi:hypothetical protein